MPVRAPSSGRAGLTIFGTTLDRRQTYILLAIVAALVLVGALVAAAVFGDDDADKTANKAGPAVGAPATAGARSPQPAGQAPTPAGQAPTSAEAPKPSAAPSSPSVEDGSTLPAGWRWYRDGNFRVPVPEGWRSTSRGSEIYFQEEAQSRRLLIVDQTRHPKSDPVADWTSQEGDRRGDYRDYHRIGIRPVSYWDKAADWEFTYTSDRGNQLRVVKRGFITANDQAYGITWIVPAGEWDADLGDLKTIYDGFQPARS